MMANIDIQKLSDIADVLGSTKTMVLILTILLIPIINTIVRGFIDHKKEARRRSGERELMVKIDMLVSILYDKNSNNITLESARDVIDAQYSKSMYEMLSDAMHFHYRNNISDPSRQKIIYERLLSKSIILYNRDILVLNKLKFADVGLGQWLTNNADPKYISESVFDRLVSGGTMDDVTDHLYDLYMNMINDTQTYMSELRSKRKNK